MAPLGILTTIVSAIRICRSSSLKAFIGSAQEGPGVAEVEAEVWHSSRFARALGKPKILEVIKVEAKGKDYYRKDEDTALSAGLYLFDDAVKNKVVNGPPNVPPASEEEQGITHNPNLLVNIGIESRNLSSTVTAAFISFALQSGVLIFTGLTKYFLTISHFEKNGKPMSSWAYPYTVSSTCLLYLGMFSYALLIERYTKEYYETKETKIY
jgi:hypothetical protein